MSIQKRKKVFLARELPKEALELLESKFEVDIWPEESPPPRSLLMQRVRSVDGIICLLTEKFDEEILNAAGKQLLGISQIAVGYDNINVQAASAKGIYVTNTPEVLTETTADFAFTLLMAVARRVAQADNYVKTGKWQIPWGLMMMLGQDIWGKTIGIIGLGRIGAAVARRAKGMNMRMLYHDAYRNEMLEKELGVEYVTLDNLLREADFVTLHVPLVPSTHHLVNEERLRTMKKTACLINTSRGPVIDEKALYKALKEGWIWGAGLDVWEKEPTEPTNPLLELDNVTAAPHIASGSYDTRTQMAIMAVENLTATLEGKVPPNLVNRDALKTRPPTSE